MCGIAGFIDTQLPPNEASDLLSKMLHRIAHRGPDASSKWVEVPIALGHNRLSIVDLSENGNQPMHGFNSVIVFNGEIYNYLEIKADLIKLGYTFVTLSDTEVVLAAYHKWGKECVSRFIGMWSLALWDKTNRILFCSRDRFGIKPFYYINENGRFYFGSEYKVFKDTAVFNRHLNFDHISRGLQLGWVSYHDQTYFSDLNSLPAASNLIYKDGKISIEKYWDLNIAVVHNCKLSESDKVEKFKLLFLDSIRLHMRSDVEVGGCLSGGLDSSSIASAVSVLFPENKFKTFSIYYEGKDEVDERPWVNMVLEKYPMLDDYYYTPGEMDVVDGFQKTIFCNDVPVTGSSPISQNFVMKLVRQKGIKVLLDGQGSDEYLAGYMHSFYRAIGGLVRQFQLSAAMTQFRTHFKLQNFDLNKTPGMLGKSVLAGFMSEQKLYEFEYYNYYPFLAKNKSVDLSLNRNDGTRLNNFLYHLLTTTSLPSLLHFEDRNSMMYSIESRVPFLDHRLVEFAFSLSDVDKFNDGITKVVLRKAMSGILPNAIVNRYDKKGFVTPGEVKWLRGPLKFLISDMENHKLDFLDLGKTKKLFSEFAAGKNENANLVWRVAVLNYWMKQEGLC